MTNDLRTRVRRGESVLGTFAFLPSPSIVEIMGYSGFDFVIIDMEHSPKSWETVESMVRAGEVSGTSTLVRIAENNPSQIVQALEVGADGIVVPFIQTREQAELAARNSRYAPVGTRGVCSVSRSSGYGMKRDDFVNHLLVQNERIFVMGLIEDQIAVENIEEILASQPGLDALMVGRADLAASLGVEGQVRHPAVLDAVERILAALGAQDSVCGAMAAYSVEEAQDWIERDVRMITHSADTSFLARGCRAFADAYHEAQRANRAVAAG